MSLLEGSQSQRLRNRVSREGILIAMEVRGGTLRKHELFVHPPTGPEPMGLARVIVAIVTLLFFALLFMPTPISM